ncbi:MAG: flagellar filament capping protein FliD, partial [Synergistaceae bacterium]|nr:flagellar filament capping protein FliD [Synergistaceae bacterium]
TYTASNPNYTTFTVSNGSLTWKETDPADASIDISDLQAKYNDKYGLASDTALPTKTLTDGDNIIRTYFDPENIEDFTMIGEDGTEYVYGRDYVLRVNDKGDGYTFEWAIEGDTNNDATIDIKDANTVVTTYTAYKNISTSKWEQAPEYGKKYNFDFTYDKTLEASGDVNKTSTDKSLATILKNVTVDSSDYSSTLTITDASGNTYAYNTDWTIDSSGNIEWLDMTPNKPSDTDTFTVSYGKTVRYYSSSTSKIGSTGNVTLYVDRGDGNGTIQVLKNQALSIINSSDEELYVSQFDSNNDPVGTKYYYDPSSTWGLNASVAYFGVNWNNYTGSDTSNCKMFYERTDAVTSSSLTTADDTYSVLNLTGTSSLPSDIAEKLTITDSNGNTYVYGKDFTANDDGTIHWIADDTPKHPADGAAYTLVYDAFTAIEATGTYDGSATQEIEIKVDEGYGHIDGNVRSYEQILDDTGLTSSSLATDWAKYFTLTDGTTTYTYGTDYTITKSDDTDSDTGEHKVLINWINAPSSTGTNFTLSYGGDGGEALTTKGVTRSLTDTITNAPLASDLKSGTNTITYGGKTYYEGYDFNIGKNDSGNATIEWIKDSEGGYEWYYPTSGSRYTITHTDDDGNTTSYNASRTSSETLDMSTYGMTTANGSIGIQYGDDERYFSLNAPDSGVGDGRTVIKGTYGIDITPTTGSSFTFNWAAPTLTSRTNLPTYGTELTVQYEYDANTFDLADDGDGDLLRALGFTKSDGTYDDYTAAQDAELEVDGQKMYRASNDIGADYDNELIKGVTMHLKGVGTVSLDISHDAQKAVESIQTFVDNYNDLMTWMNTRMTEKQVDEDTAATIDSDDFRMRWGLLHGNSLLRQTKSQMRSLTSQNFTFSFTQRKSSEEIYGSMAFNGLRTSSTLRLRIGSKYVDVTIDPTDTLETIVAKINDDTKNGPMHSIYYDNDGNKLPTPLLKASVENDILVINSTSSDEITMSGSAAMNALKMNYTYKGLYQIGIESTSDDYGKSGELVFDSNEFMEALEDNPDEVQALMMKFVSQFDTWTKGMLNSSASGETSGTLTREIENIQSQIDNINDYLERYQERLDRMEENLRTRYGNTETQFAKLSQQANSIAAILNQLNGTASGGGYGQASS